jgi:type VI secretion system protein ImpJ
MAWNSKVVWSEGMFLRPAHFQQHVRYVENMLEQRCDALRGHAVGFTSLELDPALLRLGKLAITQARGVFPDGTPFCIPQDDEAPPALDIGVGSESQGVVHLALPVRRRAAPELAFESLDDGLVRYTVREIDATDTHTRDGTSATIQIGRLNLKLVPERGRHGDLVTLGIARVIERRDDGSVVLDDAYLPPALDCRAVAPLQTLLKELRGLLRHRADALAQRVSAAGRGGTSEMSDFLLLQLANRYEAWVAHLLSRGGVHPQEFHALAVQLAAELATFTRPEKRPPEFAPYLHHDLQQSFAAVTAELRRSLGMVFEQSAIALTLEQRKYGIRVSTIADRALVKSASFVLAARADMPAEELRRRLPPQTKIGSVEQIRQLVNLQLPGVALRALPVAPRQLPYHAGFVYFELERSGEAWAGLELSGGFALHVSGEFPGLELEFWAVRE